MKMGTAKTLLCVIILTNTSTYCNEVLCTVQSNCINIKECTPFITFLETVEKPLKSSVVTFLKAHECGFEEGYPKVCCTELPKNLRILKTTIPPTTIATSTESVTTTTAEAPTTTTKKTTTKKPTIEEIINKDLRIEEFNAAFYDLLDFDLFRRRRKITDGLEVEIR